MEHLKISNHFSIPGNEFELRFARSSGPGGQNVNKVNSKVLLYWHVTQSPSLPQSIKDRFLDLYGNRVNQEGYCVIKVDESRDQKRNIQICFEKLQEMLQRACQRPKKRRPTKPTRASKEKRLKEKQVRAETKKRRGKVDDY